jgi:hypothetical protein
MTSRISRNTRRSTQLYRTLPHEIGHLVQYEREVRRPARERAGDAGELGERYFARPAREREDFANRYARELADELRGARRVPFPRLADEARMRSWRLEPAWFGVPGGV